MRRSASAAAALVALCGACASPAPVPPGGDLTVSEVLARAADLEGRSLTVNGRFAGWTGPCMGAPPRRRSDWMLAEGKRCLYVSGPVPAGVTPPPDMASVGVALSVKATLRRTADGRPYLEADER